MRNQCLSEQAAQPSAPDPAGVSWTLISTDTQPWWVYPTRNSISGQRDLCLLWPRPDACKALPQRRDQVTFKCEPGGEGWAEAHPWC